MSTSNQWPRVGLLVVLAGIIAMPAIRATEEKAFSRTQINQLQSGQKQGAKQKGKKNTAKKLQAQLEQARQENAALRKSIEQSRRKIMDLEKKLLQWKIEAQQATNQRDFAQNRVKALQQQIVELIREKEKNASVVPDKGAVNGKLNPPQEFIKGVVERVDPENKSLVLISIGSDNGIKVGHTLDVVRMKPNPKFLGTIRILNVTAGKSIGRLMQSNNLAPVAEIMKGDEVVSSVMPKGNK